MHIQPHSHARNQGKEGRPATIENRKKCPDFGTEDLDCVHLFVKFSIQNVVLRVSRRKNSEMFLCGACFSSVFDEMFIEVPQFAVLLGPFLNILSHLKPCETLTRHIQNPAIGHYSAIFKTLDYACISRNLACLEFGYIQNPSIIASWHIFRTLLYLRKFTNIQNSEPSQRFKMEFFCKNSQKL